jgi:hypothetical protein
MNPKRKKHLSNFYRPPYQQEPPIKRFKRADVLEVTSKINPTKLSGYDLITGKILKELQITGIRYLTHLFNAVLLKGCFPEQRKAAQVILILKPRKPPNNLTSYRPISLLPTVSKDCEKLFLKRLLKTVENNGFISIFQFGFRKREALQNRTNTAHCTKNK